MFEFQGAESAVGGLTEGTLEAWANFSQVVQVIDMAKFGAVEVGEIGLRCYHTITGVFKIGRAHV